MTCCVTLSINWLRIIRLLFALSAGLTNCFAEWGEWQPCIDDYWQLREATDKAAGCEEHGQIRYCPTIARTTKQATTKITTNATATTAAISERTNEWSTKANSTKANAEPVTKPSATAITLPPATGDTCAQQNTKLPPKTENQPAHRVLQYLIRGIHIDPVHVKYLLSDECKDAEAVCDAIDRLSRVRHGISPTDFQATISVSRGDRDTGPPVGPPPTPT